MAFEVTWTYRGKGWGGGPTPGEKTDARIEVELRRK